MENEKGCVGRSMINVLYMGVAQIDSLIIFLKFNYNLNGADPNFSIDHFFHQIVFFFHLLYRVIFNMLRRKIVNTVDQVIKFGNKKLVILQTNKKTALFIKLLSPYQFSNRKISSNQSGIVNESSHRQWPSNIFISTWIWC